MHSSIYFHTLMHNPYLSPCKTFTFAFGSHVFMSAYFQINGNMNIAKRLVPERSNLKPQTNIAMRST